MTTALSLLSRTNLLALDPNLSTGQVADPALRKACFDEIYNYFDTVVTSYNAFIANGGVATTNLADLSVTTAKLALLAVTAAQIALQAVGTAQLADGSVTVPKLDPAIVVAGIPLATHIAANPIDHPDGSVTISKLTTDIQNKVNLVDPTVRGVANLKAASTIANRVDGASGIFYDLNDGLNAGSNGKIDLSKTNATSAITATGSSITVPVTGGTTGFVVGQEVTIMDATNLERRNITAISAGVSISFAAMTNSYSAKALICRSSVIQDTVNKLLKFNGWSYLTTYTNTAVSVVASAYDTSGNGGRKIVLLTNGWLISAVQNGTTNIIFYKSTDSGTTWTQLCTVVTGATSYIAIASSGTIVYCFNTIPTSAVSFLFKFDASTQTNTNVAYSGQPDTGQTSFSTGCSLAIDSLGTLHASWCSKNATYPNSNNIRYSKSTDGGVTWATPTQITNTNLAGADYVNPCISTRSDNNPIIAFQSTTSGPQYDIMNAYYNGSTWTSFHSIYATVTQTQVNASQLVKKNGSNVGRVWVAWDGADSTDTTKRNIHVSYSDDSGVTQSTQSKITSGNVTDRQKPSLAENTNGDIYVTYMDSTGISYQVCANGGTTFTGTTTLNATGTNPSSIEHLGLTFTVPPTVYMSGSAVKFDGTYIAPGLTAVLVEDVRYNISPPSNVSSAVAWVDHDADANYSIAGAVSFQASAGVESYSAMTKTTAAIDGSHNEDQLVGSGAANAKATLRLTFTRNSTALVKNIQSVMGAVGA